MRKFPKLQLTAPTLAGAALLIIFALVIYRYGSPKFSQRLLPEETSKSVFAECHNAPLKDCYQLHLAAAVKQSGLSFGISVLKILQAQEPAVRFCHTLAHKMGTTAVISAPNRWSALVNEINPQECSGGYFHGILEAHASLNEGNELTTAEISSLCGQENSYRAGSCAHILGHLLLVSSLADIDQALGLCQKNSVLPLQKECFSGVFMENMTKENLSDHQLVQRAPWGEESIKETERLCGKYDADVALACWGELGHMYAAVHNDNVPVVYRLCQRSQSQEFTQYCYLKAADKMAVTMTQQSEVNQICSPFKEKETSELCISHVVSSMINNSDAFISRAQTFCEGTSNYKAYCLAAIENSKIN